MSIILFLQKFREQLNHPIRVGIVCLFFAFIHLFADGSLLGLWKLHREEQDLLYKIEILAGKTDELTKKIQQSSDPLFIEREVRDKFDLVGESDLVFIFSE